MTNSLIEAQIEKAVKDTIGENALKALKGVGQLAAKQGGESTWDNYRRLGKRTFIVFGAALVAINAAASIGGLVISRKNEEKRVEKIVHRVLEEEREAQEADAPDAESAVDCA